MATSDLRKKLKEQKARNQAVLKALDADLADALDGSEEAAEDLLEATETPVVRAAALDEVLRPYVRDEAVRESLIKTIFESGILHSADRGKTPRWDKDPVVEQNKWNKPDRCGNCGEQNIRFGNLVDSMINNAIEAEREHLKLMFRKMPPANMHPGMAARLIEESDLVRLGRDPKVVSDPKYDSKPGAVGME